MKVDGDGLWIIHHLNTRIGFYVFLTYSRTVLVEKTVCLPILAAYGLTVIAT
jgi:hypothetical protein